MTPALILSLVSILAGVLKQNPQIPGQVGQVVGDVAASLAAIFASLMGSNQTVTLNPLTIISAIGGVIVALKTDPNLPADVLAKLDSLDRALQAAIIADKLAQTQVDYTQLRPITPIV
jgi:hypothetical protein